MSLLRRRAMMRSSAGVSPILPSEYQRVEYIESNGYQYIDTGIYPVYGCKLSVDFRVNDIAALNAANGSVIYSTSQAYNVRSLDCYTAANGNVTVSYGSSFITGNVNLNTVDIFHLENELKVFSIKNTYTETIAALTVPEDNWQSPPFTLHLFAIWRGQFSPAFTGSGCAIYDFQYIQNNIVMHLIPCYRKSDGVIGMYDTVSHSFFTNAGTGTFTKGADINEIRETR